MLGFFFSLLSPVFLYTLALFAYTVLSPDWCGLLNVVAGWLAV